MTTLENYRANVRHRLDCLISDYETPGDKLGCSATSHKKLRFCSNCCGVALELTGWRLLAMLEDLT